MRASGRILINLLSCNRSKELSKFRRYYILNFIVVFLVVRRYKRWRCKCSRKMNFTDRGDKRHDFYAVRYFKIFFGNGTSGNATLTHCGTEMRMDPTMITKWLYRWFHGHCSYHR